MSYLLGIQIVGFSHTQAHIVATYLMVLSSDLMVVWSIGLWIERSGVGIPPVPSGVLEQDTFSTRENWLHLKMTEKMMMTVTTKQTNKKKRVSYVNDFDFMAFVTRLPFPGRARNVRRFLKQQHLWTMNRLKLRYMSFSSIDLRFPLALLIIDYIRDAL